MKSGFPLNYDDPISDPDWIAANYQAGRNAYFEVSLVLAEASSRGSISSSSAAATAPVIIPGPGGGEGPGGGGPGCPQVDQYVWTDDHKTVKASMLIGQTGIHLYNPLSRNFNLVKSAEILENQPLFKIVTGKGYESIVSVSHKIIMNTADIYGISLMHYGVGREILSFDEGIVKKVKNWNIYTDVLVEISNAGFGDVVKIELEKEFIYVCGTSNKQGTVAHNRKPVLED